ncbi:MAG: hypothetical protein A4E67_00973 [Syntrophaceae bacterium PtaB.Bin038]|nr:MAG: hypothetical protein A4E67_00973 [Syntrophaceae bacterium PtaB.Bin038]
MTGAEKQMVCIHCRQADGLEPVALTERGREWAWSTAVPAAGRGCRGTRSTLFSTVRKKGDRNKPFTEAGAPGDWIGKREVRS